jgi:hypothetical protein
MDGRNSSPQRDGKSSAGSLAAKVSRRAALAAAAAGTAAVAAAQNNNELEARVRKAAADTSQALAGYKVPMATEPAFRFEA